MKFGVLAGLRSHFQLAPVLFCDNLMGDSQPHTRAFAWWFSSKKGVKYLLLIFWGNAGPVIGNANCCPLAVFGFYDFSGNFDVGLPVVRALDLYFFNRLRTLSGRLEH